MSFQNMTEHELRRALILFGFPREKKGGEAGRPSEGFTECGLWLQTRRGGERIARMASGKTAVPTELAYLFRLMKATGYTPEMVASLPPIKHISESE